MMKIGKNDTVIFVGDSVTDCGRSPSGEGSYNSMPYGNGYVNFTTAFFVAAHPEYDCRFINKGCSGHTSAQVLARLETDVLSYHPDVVTLMIGVNDAGYEFHHPADPAFLVTREQFEHNLRTLIDKITRVTPRLLLITPYLCEPDRNEPLRRKIDSFIEVYEQLAREYDLTLINTQELIDRYLQHQNTFKIAHDRVHPSDMFHMAIANAILNEFEAE